MGVPLLFGPYGRDALERIDLLPLFGANALWFHGFDDEAFEACGQYGIAPCVEYKTFRADFGAHPELIPIGADGRPIRYGRLVQGICLSQDEYLCGVEEGLREGVCTYMPAGIWLDYLTYAGWFETPSPDLQDSCFCPRCIAEFCESTGLDATTPEAILGRHADLWALHKTVRIAHLALHYAEIIRRHAPGCVVGAYMCPWRSDEYEGALGRIFGQDYDLLAPAIDVFTPLIYATKSGRPMDWGRTWLESTDGLVPPERKVQLILDALDGPETLHAVAAAARPTWGLQVFGGAALLRESARARPFQETVAAIRQRIETAGI
ncbi:MAG: hypothetical protein ACYC5M_12195 [Anaerolineae bacterium]